MPDLHRKIYTYRHTLMIAERMASQAAKEYERDNSIAAIMFCLFSLEGYLNHAGGELVPDWDNLYEILRPKAKLIFIADKYNFNFTFGAPPFQSFTTIFEVRNQLAHPKTRKHSYMHAKGKTWLEIGTTKWPADKWELLCEAAYADKFVSHTKQMIQLLDSALPLERVPAFVLSMNV